METLRATGRGRKEVKKKQMYDEHGNLVAWNSLRKIDVEEDRKLPSNMDLTPEGMKLKKVSKKRVYHRLLLSDLRRPICRVKNVYN